MGKACGVSRRRKKKFNYNINRKRLHKKALAMPKIKCEQIKMAWDPKKSYLNNIKEMGLSADPNKTIHSSTSMEVDSEPRTSKKTKARKNQSEKKTKQVVHDLEAEANAPQERTLRLPTEAIKYCVYMIEKYAEDYKAMAYDEKNYYQETPAQIRNRINKFKNIPQQWNGYLRAKGLLTGKSKVEEYTIDIDKIMGSQNVDN